MVPSVECFLEACHCSKLIIISEPSNFHSFLKWARLFPSCANEDSKVRSEAGTASYLPANT